MKQKAGTQQNTRVPGTSKQQVQDAVQARIVRGPDKMERIEDYLMAKLPYHPQYVRKGTRFDADLVMTARRAGIKAGR